LKKYPGVSLTRVSAVAFAKVVSDFSCHAALTQLVRNIKSEAIEDITIYDNSMSPQISSSSSLGVPLL
jgi:hypothetical protein